MVDKLAELDEKETVADRETDLPIPDILPVLPLKDVVVFPYIILPLSVSRERSINAVDAALAEQRIIMLVAQRRLAGLPFLESTDVLAGKPTTYLFLVMLFASVGALLTAIPSFLQVPSDFSPFNLPLQQGLLKIASGPVVAVVGFAILKVLNSTQVVNSDVVNVGVPASASAVLVLAVVFGAAQHLVTRYVDRRADEVLGALAPEKKTEA